MAQRAPDQLPDDPSSAFVNSSCFDLLLIELVPMAFRIAADLAAKEEAWLATKRRSLKPNRHSMQSQSVPSNAGAAGSSVAGKGGGPGAAVAGGKKGAERELTEEEKAFAGLGVGQIGGTAPGMDEEELREAVFYRLEGIGYRVGLGITEKFSRDRPRLVDPLDTMKFVCKDLWTLVFRKQIDNLKTNHRGVYVLTDNNFKPLKNMSLDRGRDAATQMAQAQPFLYFPAGLIRGALASLGIQASVVAESSELPGVTFQIRTAGSRP